MPRIAKVHARRCRELRGDPIAEPLPVPPFDRVDVDAVDHGAVVEVVATGGSGLSLASDHRPARDHLARGDRGVGEVRVEAL